MSAASAPAQPVFNAGTRASAGETPAEIDASAPATAGLLLLFVCAAGWIALGSALSLIASIKFHSASFLADLPWLTYGRVHPASLNAILYGFAVPAGSGVALWLSCRLGRTKLAWPGLVVLASLFWNLGVAIGLVAILAGDGTGLEWLEMPRYASPILFTAYALLGVSGLATFHRKQERELFPSQWFIVAAAFWFPWIYSTANLLLVFTPVRGVAQAAVNWWYVNNLATIWLGFIGLATIFYLLPKITARPLHSRYLAMFSFWTLALFGSWIGVPSGAPLPAWMPAVSTACAVLTAIPVLAVAVNCRKTMAGNYSKLKTDVALRFIIFGAVAWVVAGLATAAQALPAVSTVVQFTWFTAAQTQLALIGFFAMTMFGAIYHIVPRLVPSASLCRKMIRLHFWCATFGTVFLVIPLAAAGIREGLALGNADITFMQAVKLTLPFLRFSTFGELLITIGNVTLVLNLVGLAASCCRAWLAPKLAAARAEQPSRLEVAT